MSEQVTERERAMLDAAQKYEELCGDGHELYGWLRGQAKGMASALLWSEMTRRRRRTTSGFALDESGIRARRLLAQDRLTPPCCGCGECELVPPEGISNEFAKELLGDIDTLRNEVARLRESERRAHQDADAQEDRAAHFRSRALEFFRRCIAPNTKAQTQEMRVYGIHQFSVDAHIVQVSNGDALECALDKWWRSLVEPHDFPENQQLPEQRLP